LEPVIPTTLSIAETDALGATTFVNVALGAVMAVDTTRSAAYSVSKVVTVSGNARTVLENVTVPPMNDALVAVTLLLTSDAGHETTLLLTRNVFDEVLIPIAMDASTVL
jgi:hypothetical protein